jgi:predicted nucleic-acid-binding protein
MQIIKAKTGAVEVKTKKATILIDGVTSINDVELEGTGEYEIGEVSVEGVDDNTYIFQAEDMSVGFVNFTCKITKEVVEKLSNTDVMIIKLNGEIAEAVEQVGQAEPSAAVYLGVVEAEKKLAASGVTFEKVDSIKITKADLEGEQKAYFVEIQDAKCPS